MVRCEPDSTDARFTNVILTDDGLQTLANAAPSHVARERTLVIDVLSPEQLRRLGRDADLIMSCTGRRESNVIGGAVPLVTSSRVL